MEFEIKCAGDSAAVVIFGDKISPEINQKVCLFQAALERDPIEGVTETVPAYCSLMVCYNPEIILWEEMYRRLSYVGTGLISGGFSPGRLWEIPVWYGGEAGPDLSAVAQFHGLSPEEVIQIHTSRDYLVYMLGFLPGFPYLGGMDQRIAAPRLDTPRVSIPVGSVGIAGAQTGVYPIASSGGWRLIGRTPIRFYDPERSQPFLAQAGDHIRFYEIDRRTFLKMEEQTNHLLCQRRGEQEAL